MLGSMPRMSSTSRSVPGGVATENRVVGQSMLSVWPSAIATIGRLTWKS